jgi:hypothetical protein
MAVNIILAQVLAGISALKTRGKLDAVRDAVKDHCAVLKNKVVPPRFLTEEDKVALAKGNSKAMIRVNKEVFDYSSIREKDLLLVQRWFNGPQTLYRRRRHRTCHRLLSVASLECGDLESLQGMGHRGEGDWKERFFDPRRGERGRVRGEQERDRRERGRGRDDGCDGGGAR